MPLRRNRNLGVGWGQCTGVRRKDFSEMGISQKNQTRQKRFSGFYETVSGRKCPTQSTFTDMQFNFQF